MFCCACLFRVKSDVFVILSDRHPVLFAVDDFQALYHKTKYRDPQFIPINPYHLSIPRSIMEFASGKKTFVRLPTQSRLRD